MKPIEPVYAVPQTAEHRVIHNVSEGPFRYQGWPSVLCAKDGTLYAVASSFRLAHVCPFGKNAMFVSRDNGVTWSCPRIVNDTWLDDRDTGIVQAADGRFLISWFEHPLVNYEKWIRGSSPLVDDMLDRQKNLPAGYPEGGSFLRASRDGGETWGERIIVPVSAPHGPICGKDGLLYYFGKEMNGQNMRYDTTEFGRIALYVSADNGDTWEERGVCPEPKVVSWNNLHEPHMAILPDGTFVGMIRAENVPGYPSYTMLQTFSHDGGRTWSTPEETGVFGSPPHLLLHSSGALICSYARRIAPFGEFAMVSTDGGKTWPRHYAVDDRASDGDLGYPCSTELPDGSILTVYYQKVPGEDCPCIQCTRWTL